jgi:hypothetical protein
MPRLSEHQSHEFTKMMVLGDPSSGKTGSLTPLVKAGYWLGILDFDNGLDPLVQFIKRECPDKINNVEYRTLRDKTRMTPQGRVIEGSATAFTTAYDMLDHWKYGSVDEGNPWKWGSDRILVIDSLTFMAQAAFDWREQLTMGKTGKYDQRAVYYDAQKAISSTIATITSERFRTNVIVLTHIRYQETESGIPKGYPNSIGQAISTMIGAYFNSVALCQVTQGGKRVIRTASTPQIDLKNPKPFAMATTLPIETGLADFFAALRENEAPKPQPTRPKHLTLRRV